MDYVANTYPFTSAQIWIKENDLLNVCLNQGFDSCCTRINGGWNGYDDRPGQIQDLPEGDEVRIYNVKPSYWQRFCHALKVRVWTN